MKIDTFCIFIPEGGVTYQIITLPTKVPEWHFWRDELRLPNVCMGAMPFGTRELSMVAIHDDEFLLKKKNPVGTVVIVGILLCSNVVIARQKGEDWVGFTQDELDYVLPRLKFAGGKIIRKPCDNDMPCVESFNDIEDFMKITQREIELFATINEDEWGDKK